MNPSKPNANIMSQDNLKISLGRLGDIDKCNDNMANLAIRKYATNLMLKPAL